MSEMELGGKVKLTVPQLRVYLDCMSRKIDAIENRIGGLQDEYQKRVQIGEREGIKYAVEELLKCLNLFEDWPQQMDAKEDAEVRANSPCPRIRAGTYEGCDGCPGCPTESAAKKEEN